MADEDRDLSLHVDSAGVLSTNVVGRVMAHAKQFAGNRSRSLAVGEDIFTAIRRCDVSAVKRIVSACPTVVFSLNKRGYPPLLYALAKFISNDSYWRWINAQSSPPIPRPRAENSSELFKWRIGLWRKHVKQQESLVEILCFIRETDPTDVYREEESPGFLELPDEDDFIFSEIYFYISAKIRLSISCHIPRDRYQDYIMNEQTRAYEELGDWQSAIAVYETIRPDDEKYYYEARLRLCRLLCYCPNKSIRDPIIALEIANSLGYDSIPDLENFYPDFRATNDIEKPLEWPWVFPDMLSRHEWLNTIQWKSSFPTGGAVDLFYYLPNLSRYPRVN